MIKQHFLGLSAVMLVCACATPPEEISSQYTSTFQFEELSCPQIGAEMVRRNTRVSELYIQLDKEAENDEAQMAAGLILFWPTLFFLEGGDDARAGEYARLKGELDALESVAILKECSKIPAKWQIPVKESKEN